MVVLRTDGQPFCVRLDAPLGKPVAGIVSKVLKACAKKFGDECWALGEARIRHGDVVIDGAKVVDALEDGATLVVERASARRPEVRMLVFVACHCDAELRAASLERCLASLTGAQICVSWHATTRALARRVAAALAGLPPGAVARGCLRISLRAPRPCLARRADVRLQAPTHAHTTVTHLGGAALPRR